MKDDNEIMENLMTHNNLLCMGLKYMMNKFDQCISISVSEGESLVNTKLNLNFNNSYNELKITLVQDSNKDNNG